jgi:hypothetical protein
MMRALPPGLLILAVIVLTCAVHRINAGIAVIIYAIITDLHLTRIYICVCVVTIFSAATAAFDGVTIKITVSTIERTANSIHISSIDQPITIIVDAVVTVFNRTRVDVCIVIVTVDRTTGIALYAVSVKVHISTINIAVHRVRIICINQTIAVVVDAVTTVFRRARVSTSVAIIKVGQSTATLTLDKEAVTVCIGAGEFRI